MFPLSIWWAFCLSLVFFLGDINWQYNPHNGLLFSTSLSIDQDTMYVVLVYNHQNYLLGKSDGFSVCNIHHVSKIRKSKEGLLSCFLYRPAADKILSQDVNVHVRNEFWSFVHASLLWTEVDLRVWIQRSGSASVQVMDLPDSYVLSIGISFESLYWGAFRTCLAVGLSPP